MVDHIEGFLLMTTDYFDKVDAEFRQCVGFPLYEVNRAGVIRNIETGEVRKRNANGYISLRKDGKYYLRAPWKLANIAFPMGFRDVL